MDFEELRFYLFFFVFFILVYIYQTPKEFQKRIKLFQNHPMDSLNCYVIKSALFTIFHNVAERKVDIPMWTSRRLRNEMFRLVSRIDNQQNHMDEPSTCHPDTVCHPLGSKFQSDFIWSYQVGVIILQEGSKKGLKDWVTRWHSILWKGRWCQELNANTIINNNNNHRCQLMSSICYVLSNPQALGWQIWDWNLDYSDFQS